MVVLRDCTTHTFDLSHRGVSTVLSSAEILRTIRFKTVRVVTKA